jgi:putative Ca2+/H+ antiporter (TMEM165/GDT1 family)
VVIGFAGPRITPLNAFLLSTGLVALAEIGDKTQLLAVMLTARYRRPWLVIAGILAATLLNHALAAALGAWLMDFIGPQLLRWTVGASFLAMGAWTLIPDKLDDDDATARSRAGVFVTTVVAFFLAEMGDKTQVATVALAARFHDIVSVVAGTTLGMMVANVPAALLGDRFAARLPIVWIRRVAAAVFALLGIATLAGAGAG